MAGRRLRSTKYRLSKLGIRECKVILEKMCIEKINKQLAEREKKLAVNVNVQCRVIDINETQEVDRLSSSVPGPRPVRLPWMKKTVPFTTNSFAS